MFYKDIHTLDCSTLRACLYIQLSIYKLCSNFEVHYLTSYRENLSSVDDIGGGPKASTLERFHCIIFIFLLFLPLAVPERPPTPPSQSQKLVQSSNNYNQPQTFFETLKSILKNYYFIMLLVTAAINLGAAGATVSLFNELIHPYFKNHDKDVAYIGVTAQVPAMITVFVIGPILSHTKAF